ncbi:histidine kinase [Nostoc sp. FACHB-857]|nr:histidine kinase [Nostoc sp. FACHB-857]
MGKWQTRGTRRTRRITHAQCPTPNAQCPMSNVQCPMPNAQCPIFIVASQEIK